MVELLDELAMVEMEINRLENQITALKSESKHEEERVHTEPNLQEWELANQRSINQESPSPLSPPDPCYTTTSKRANEKVTSFEMKALHFITKAIKGEYKVSDFTLNDRATDSKRFSNHDDQIREKPSKRGALLRRPFPSRHPTPKVVAIQNS